MSDLVTFLRARLDEDEDRSKRAAFGWGAAWTASPEEDGEYWAVHADGKPYMVESEDGDVVQHIARHDPARVLAEVAAKRAIVALHRQVDGMGYSPDEPGEGSYGRMSSVCTTCGTADEYGEPWPCSTLKALALPYAGHPDYREEWRP